MASPSRKPCIASANWPPPRGSDAASRKLDARFGFTTNRLALTIELKDGVKHQVEFGGTSPEKYPYAAVTLDGQTWFFEFPIALHQLMVYALLPSGPP